MFVIVQCWSNLERSGGLLNLPLAESIGLTLKHAGVAITITSLTDIFAFAVGSITVLSSSFRFLKKIYIYPVNTLCVIFDRKWRLCEKAIQIWS